MEKYTAIFGIRAPDIHQVMKGNNELSVDCFMSFSEEEREKLIEVNFLKKDKVLGLSIDEAFECSGADRGLSMAVHGMKMRCASNPVSLHYLNCTFEPTREDIEIFVKSMEWDEKMKDLIMSQKL